MNQRPLVRHSPPNERQRPVRAANRPPKYRDTSFETHFQSVPRRHCRKVQKRNPTGHEVTNVGKYRDLGRGENKKNVTPTGSKNATSISSQKITKTVSTTHIHSERNTRQKQHFHLETSRHPRFILNFHLDPTKELLATSRSLENSQRRYPRGKEGRMKSAVLSYPLMNTKDAESSAKMLSTHQKRSRTAHLRFKSTSRPRVSTDYLSATPRGSEANKTVISDPPAACPRYRRARASTADARPMITTWAARNRRAATTPIDIVKADVSSDESAESASVSVDREMQTADNSTLRKSVHVDTYNFYLQPQDHQINKSTCRHRYNPQILPTNAESLTMHLQRKSIQKKQLLPLRLVKIKFTSTGFEERGDRKPRKQSRRIEDHSSELQPS